MNHQNKAKILPDPALKGVKDGNCNRQACQKPRAIFYNHATKKYYCTPCARLINDCNRRDSMELYGHDLCTLEKQEDDE